MFYDYIKITFRNILNRKIFSVINILGFAFSISVCLAIFIFLLKEKSYDTYHINANYIYRLTDAENNTSNVDFRVKQILLDSYPEIENACIFKPIPFKVAVTYKNTGYRVDDLLAVENTFFRMFSIQFILGNRQNAFQDMNSIVITESCAKTIFNQENPLGKEIDCGFANPFKVTGVIKDFPDNSSITGNVLINIGSAKGMFGFSCQNSSDSSTYRYPFNIYLQIKEKAYAEGLLQKINNHPEVTAPFIKKCGLLPLKEMYMNDGTKGGGLKRGNTTLMKIMSIISLIVLALAIINYVNLTIAQQNRRNKETGIRKTVGADRKDLIIQYLYESMITSFLAFIFALIILKAGLPFFSKIVDTELSMTLLFRVPVIFIMPVIVFLIGLFSGLGPAIIISEINPVKILSGNYGSPQNKKIGRNLLTVFQFTVSIALIFSLIVIQQQLSFARHQDAGFAKDQLVRIEYPRLKESEKKAETVLLDKLSKSPYIESMSASMGTPAEINMRMGSGVKDKKELVMFIFADSSFLRTFGVKLLRGRSFLAGDKDKACLMNESAFNYFGWKDLDNKRFNNGGGYDVIGVVKNFQLGSLREAIGPLCIVFSERNKQDLSVRIKAGMTGPAMDYIKKVWKETIPYSAIDYKFYDEWYDSIFRRDERFASTIALFTVLAICISCMGILGLAVYSSERRTKEIGIRRISGATVMHLMFLLNKDFIKWVIVAYVIACPAAWYVMNIWLREFAYRIDISGWVFAYSGIIAIAIALMSVSWQTWRASSQNPAQSLRSE